MLLKIFGEKVQKIELKKRKRIKEILLKKRINADLFIIRKNKEIVLADEFVENKDEIELIPISSGG
jgi:sulfur carrier protein ThiS